MLLTPNTNKYRFCGVGIPIPILTLFIFLVIVYSLLPSMGDSTEIEKPAPVAPVAPGAPQPDFHFEYTVIKGLFLQSEESTNDKTFDFRTQNFGLIDRSYPTDSSTPGDEASQWPRFEKYVRSLNAECKEGESVKVLFLGRHGEGWHNVAEAKYGTPAWDCYYSHLPSYANLTFTDAHLTPLGVSQATSVSALWASLLPLSIPPPETYYVSPLTRTLQTANYTFSSLPLPDDKPYVPLVKELLREALGVHTCDKRSTRSEIAAAFPNAVFEKGFSEEDGLWEKDYREPGSARRYRLATLLDDVFEHDDKVVLSLTAHSGAIASILEVLRHRSFRLETGGVIPVVVHARRVGGARVRPPWEPSDAPPMCEEPPL